MSQQVVTSTGEITPEAECEWPLTPVCCYCDHPMSCARCGKEQPFDDVSVLRAQLAAATKALEAFTKHYEPWMERLSDDDQMSIFPRHTMGDLRRARSLTNGAKMEQSSSQ